MKKRILILNQTISSTFISLYKRLIEHYGSGTIITASYNQDDSSELVEFINAPSYSSSSILSRFYSWIKYYLFVLQWLKKNKNNYDLVFLSTNPAICPFLGLKIKKTLNCPYIVLVWDIYPNVITMKMKNIIAFFISKLWYKINSIVYNKSISIITIGDVMSETLIFDYPLIKNKVKVIPNWTDPNKIMPIAKDENEFINKYNLKDKFILLYSGKMGLGHDLNTIIKASNLLQDEKEIAFVFIGHGPGYDLVENYIKNCNPSNVLLLSHLSDNDFKFAVSAGDVGLVAQESGMGHLFMPCKTYNLMSAGLALIGISDGENDLKRTITNGSNGFNVKPGDVNQLVERIKELYQNPVILNEMKEISRKLVVTRYNEDQIFKEYLEEFDRILDSNE